MALVYLGLGSNLGDRGANLAAARRGLAKLADTVLIDNAPVYETSPVGGPSGQGNFYNSACLVKTRLEPMDFLRATQELERAIGRVRERETSRWGPRVIDIDILLWGDSVVEEPDLVVPHPHLAERAFALMPLVDLDRDLLHPVLDMTVKELLERIDLENEGIRRLPL